MQRSFGPILFFAFLICVFMTPGVQAAAEGGFQRRLAADSHAYMIARDGLKRAVEFAGSRQDLFAPDKDRKKGLMTRQEKLIIWNSWSSVLDAMAALDAIRGKWKNFSLFQDKERRNSSFDLNNACFLAGYRYALEFIALSDKNAVLDTILDEAVPELGLPAGTYGRFKFRFLNVAAATEFSALQVIDRGYANGAPGKLRQFIEDDGRVIWKMGKGKGHVLTVKNALAVVKKGAFNAWFPLQRNVSEWMGDTKVRRKGAHLISGEQIASLGKRLQPGDILFERHEWYLSNMGLPGFWTHAAMYVGTPAERRAFFSDPETTAWVKRAGVADGDLEKLLRKRFPKAYAAGTTPLADGFPPRILEAISEGVSFTSLEFSGAADSIGVLRPRLSRREKAEAVMRAFHYSGRPYDFNFDFQTDSSLVCSELVFKAYETGPGMEGLRFPVSEIMGRRVSTPNNMVRQFDEQYGNRDTQTDFVLFLDGFEKEKRAVESTPEEFRKSWTRPNWHILIQDAPKEMKAERQPERGANEP